MTQMYTDIIINKELKAAICKKKAEEKEKKPEAKNGKKKKKKLNFKSPFWA
jgi:hypothetical protein